MDVDCGSKRTARRRLRAVLPAAFVAATLLGAPGTAHAQSSAVDQYVEDIPTGSGKAHPGTTPPARTELPAPVTAQIAEDGGSDAPLLREVVSSATYGAPQTQPRDPGGAEIAAGATDDVDDSGALSAAVTAVEGGDTGRLVGLLGVLLAISLAALGAAVFRSRRGSA